MTLNVFVDDNFNAFSLSQVQKQFVEFYQNYQEDTLNDFLTNRISSGGRDFLFKAILQNDVDALAIVNQEFEDFLAEVEEEWIGENFQISTIEL